MVLVTKNGSGISDAVFHGTINREWRHVNRQSSPIERREPRGSRQARAFNAFDTLSERYREQLFRAAHRITRSYEDAEDAVQDTLLRALCT